MLEIMLCFATVALPSQLSIQSDACPCLWNPNFPCHGAREVGGSNSCWSVGDTSSPCFYLQPGFRYCEPQPCTRRAPPN